MPLNAGHSSGMAGQSRPPAHGGGIPAREQQEKPSKKTYAINLRDSGTVYFCKEMKKDEQLNDNFIISLSNVSVKIQGHTLLSDLTWQLGRGEHWALIGGNGAGKSTLLRLIRGELWPDPGSPGKRLYKFDSAAQESPIGIKNRIALVSAELHDAYHRHQWNMSGREVVYTGFFDSAWLHQKPTEEQKTAADKLLCTMKLDNLGSKDFLEMSQGEAIKILIARAVLARPAILALDEPCNGLDFSSRKKLLHMIEEIAAAGTPVLYATHRVEELIPSITHILIMDHGKIIEQGQKDCVLAGERLHYAFARDMTELPPPSVRLDRRFSFLIKIKHADVFIKQTKILHDISWVMHKAEHWAIIGRNGAGKSTMLKLIAGDLYPALGGEVQRFGRKSGGSIWDIRKRIGIVSPELQRDYAYDVKGIDAVVSGFFSSVGLYGTATSGQRETAGYWIDFFQLQHLSEKLLSQMSYGEQRKILIARAMANSPDLLIVDEPCSGLDSAARAGFLSFMAQAARSGASVIMATHHPDEIISLITHIIVMDKGRIIAQGEKEEIIKSHQDLLFADPK